MQLFAFFLLACFLLGILLRRFSNVQRSGVALLWAVFLAMAYFFLDRI